jgi:hypothetical protein
MTCFPSYCTHASKGAVSTTTDSAAITEKLTKSPPTAHFFASDFLLPRVHKTLFVRNHRPALCLCVCEWTFYTFGG